MRASGFTLVEMVVVVAVFGLVAIYVGQILTANERAYHTVGATSEAQQNLRIFGELIESDIRHAGMMVPPEAAVCGVDATNGPDTLYLSDADAIDPQADFDPYTGATVTAGSIAEGATGDLQLDGLVLEPPTPTRPAFDANGDGVLDSDFRAGSGVIVADIANPTRGAACGRIVSVDVANERIRVTGAAALAVGGANPPRLVAVPANEFRIDGTQLLWNSVVIADGIEDLQVGLVFDIDGDNVVDDPEDIRGDGARPDYDSSEYSAASAREILVGLVARTRIEEDDFVGRPQALFNRANGGFVDDGFRRRTFETRVRLRNLVSRSTG